MNDVVRISPSVLDGFRYYINYGNSVDEYIESLKNSSEFSLKARVGTCLHSVLEHSVLVGDELSLFFDGYRTNIYIDASCVLENPTITELKAVKSIEVDGYQIDLVGKADAIYGNMGKDYKFTFSSSPTDRFIESVQWKIYMMLFDLELFRYIIFRCKGDEKKVSVYEVEHYDIYRNQYIESDVYSLSSQFVDFIIKNDIYNYFVYGTEEYMSKYKKTLD